ncbi:MAG: SDR family oxidoreductase [Gammaproteobacteria bacterium]|nr:SDR family oxidoreductase [Gammaproteobacteria bacterium]
MQAGCKKTPAPTTEKNYAIITGASRGIGLASATLFLQHHYEVINLSRRACPLPDAKNCLVDLGDPAAFSTLNKTLPALLSYPNKITLVHCAMCLGHDNVYTADSHTLRTTLEIGIVAALRLNQLCLPFMKKNSSLIFVGSTLSEISAPNTLSYTIQKHALLGLMRATCQDLTGSGIHTACVCPGFTRTDMLNEHLSLEAQQEIIKLVAGRRLIESDEIARCIHFCAENPVINGSVLHAHLGQAIP